MISSEPNLIPLYVRAIQLIAASENAGLCPIQGNRLHVLAYLANLLSPTWGLSALEGKLLKLKSGPYYPTLQQSIDALIGMGLVEVTELTYQETQDGNTIPNGLYQPRNSHLKSVLAAINSWADEARMYLYIKEIAYAISALPQDYIELTSTQDATYTDPSIDYGNVIDFAEWRTKNFSANAANSLSLIQGQEMIENSEKLHFYVSHLYSRIQHGK